MRKLLGFLARLRAERLHYTLEQARDEALLVFVSVPGERWEVEFLADDTVNVEVFRSDGRIVDESALGHMLAELSAGDAGP